MIDFTFQFPNFTNLAYGLAVEVITKRFDNRFLPVDEYHFFTDLELMRLSLFVFHLSSVYGTGK